MGELTVRAGTSYSEREGSVHKVDRTIVHECFERSSKSGLVNDIALIHLTDSLIVDDTRRPIKLFEQNEVITDHSPAIVSGWGKTISEKTASQLQMMYAPIVSREQCSEAYSKILAEPLVEGRFCAGYFGIGGRDACNGDSGGPLAIKGRLAGIISFGLNCVAMNRIPGIYTEIAHFRDWIKNHTGI